jgi:hypothetical protein
MKRKDLSMIELTNQVVEEDVLDGDIDEDCWVDTRTDKAIKLKRVVTNEDVIKYKPMIESYLRKNIAKNWNEASTNKTQGDIALGNSGMTMNDFRQHLMTEVVVAIQNYNPEYRTPDGKSVKESTFVFQHLFNRTGQLMKKLTKRRYGYGVWTNDINEVVGDYTHEE